MIDLKHLTDEQLAIRYIDGDVKAFDELLKRTQQRLYNYILCIVKSPSLADDLFQDTYVKIINRLNSGKYSDNGKFISWATRIAHNLIMDYFRHQKASGQVEKNEELDITAFKSGVFGKTVSRESEIVYEQTLSDVKRVMNALPASQREVVYMRFYQNLSFKEIADITDVSINTALGRMRYAILNMRKIAKQHNLSLVC